MDAGRFLKACAPDDLQQVSHTLTEVTSEADIDLLVQGLAVANISGATSVAELLRPVVQTLANQVDGGSPEASSDGAEVRGPRVDRDTTMQQTSGVPVENDHARGEPVPPAMIEESGSSALLPSPPLEALFRADALSVARRLRDLAGAMEGVDVALVARAIAAVRAAVERGDPVDVEEQIQGLKECRAEGLLAYLASWVTPSGKRPLPLILLGGAYADDIERLLTREWPSLAGQPSAADATASRDGGDV